MRILMLNANLAGCGTYHRALWFGRLLARHGRHDVTLCTVSPALRFRRETCTRDGVRISAGPHWGFRTIPGYGSNWLDIAWRWRELRFGGYDVVYAFEYHPNVRWPIYAGLRDSQTLLSDWCDWYAGAANVFRGCALAHRWDARCEERIRLRARRVSVISEALQARTLALGLPPERVWLIREGVDTRYMTPHDRDESRRLLGIAADARVVGTLNDGHAFPHLLAAFGHCRARLPQARLLFVGGLSAAQRRLAAAQQLEQSIIVTGRCSDELLPRYLAAADVFALPLEDTLANRARFPHKIGDYLACGRPLVVSAVGDYPALLRRADAAIVVDRLDDLPATLCRVLQDPACCHAYATRGRQWVEQHLDWELLAPQVCAFVEGRAAPAPFSPAATPGMSPRAVQL